MPLPSITLGFCARIVPPTPRRVRATTMRRNDGRRPLAESAARLAISRREVEALLENASSKHRPRRNTRHSIWPYQAWWRLRELNPFRPRSKRGDRIQTGRTDTHQRAPKRTPIGSGLGSNAESGIGPTSTPPASARTSLPDVARRSSSRTAHPPADRSTRRKGSMPVRRG